MAKKQETQETQAIQAIQGTQVIQETQVIQAAKEIIGTANFDHFSDQEVDAVYRVSYSFRYGVLVRLALTIGIRLGELLALRWDDLGPNNTLIINKTITSLPMSFDNGSVEKPSCFRLITLPMNVVYELCQLKNAQYTDIIKNGNVFDTFQFVITDNMGHPVAMETFLREYYNILLRANVRQLPFSALLNTFVYNSLKAGVDSNTVAQIIGVQPGRYFVSGEAIQQIPQMTSFTIPELRAGKSYPVIVTPENGSFHLSVVDFEDLSCEINDIQKGLNFIAKWICEKSRQIALPEPTSPCEIKLNKGEYIAMATINP